MADFDLAIIGGGINGAGIARDAAGRGLRVLLVEQNDLASGTSSKSTKLIHGGLRYLEFYAFRLVREALIEREVLIRIAPHLTRPMRFVLPHHAGPAARPGCCGSACSSTTISAAAKSCPAPRWSISPTMSSASRSSASSARASSIRTAGSTMRASSCSTRSMRPSAAPSIRTRTRLVRADRAGRALAARAQCAGQARDRHGARAGQRGRRRGCRTSPSTCCG